MLGLVYCNLGDYHKALDCHFKALHIKEKFLGKEHPETAVSYNNLAEVYRKQRKFKKALEYYSKVVGICTKKPNDNYTKIATVLNNIGLTYYELDNTSEALKYYMIAASVNEKTYGKEHVNPLRRKLR